MYFKRLPTKFSTQRKPFEIDTSCSSCSTKSIDTLPCVTTLATILRYYVMCVWEGHLKCNTAEDL